MEFGADSRWLGPSHSRAETTIGGMAVNWTFTGQQDARAMEAGVSLASSSGRSKSRTSLSRRSPFRCFHEGDQVAGCIDEFGAERPYREGRFGSVIEEGTETGHRTTCCRTGRANCHVHREGEEAIVQCRRVRPMGSGLEIGVYLRVDRGRIAVAKTPCRGRGNGRRTPRTPRLGSRGQETPTVSDRIAVSKAFVQSSPSVPHRTVICRSSPDGAETSRQAKSLRGGGAFTRANTRRVVVHQASGTQRRFGDRGCIRGGGVEPTLGHRGCEIADIVRGRFHGGKFGEVRFLQGRSRRKRSTVCERRGSAKPVTRVLQDAKGRVEASQKMCWMHSSMISPKMVQIPLNQVCGEGRQHLYKSQMLTVPACSNEVRVFSRTSVGEASAAKRIRGSHCVGSSRSLLSEIVENINPHTERQTHNFGRIPINCRGEQEKD